MSRLLVGDETEHYTPLCSHSLMKLLHLTLLGLNYFPGGRWVGESNGNKANFLQVMAKRGG